MVPPRLVEADCPDAFCFRLLSACNAALQTTALLRGGRFEIIALFQGSIHFRVAEHARPYEMYERPHV
jgi:hypothetical protein